MAEAGVVTIVDNMAKVVEAIARLASTRVMVGVPSEQALRRPAPGEPRQVNNAMLAYIHENGAPTVGIPPRPFLRPGVKDARTSIAAALRIGGVLALKGDAAGMERQFHIAGARARDAVKLKITTGPFVPLKPATIAKRRVRSRGSKYRRKATTAAQVTPLVDTGALRNAINYVIRRVYGR